MQFPLAQLVEHQTASHWIDGSNPVAGRVSFYIQSIVKNDRKTEKAPLPAKGLEQVIKQLAV